MAETYHYPDYYECESCEELFDFDELCAFCERCEECCDGRCIFDTEEDE
jgi:hypothetical protein